MHKNKNKHEKPQKAPEHTLEHLARSSIFWGSILPQSGWVSANLMYTREAPAASPLPLPPPPPPPCNSIMYLLYYSPLHHHLSCDPRCGQHLIEYIFDLFIVSSCLWLLLIWVSGYELVPVQYGAKAASEFSMNLEFHSSWSSLWITLLIASYPGPFEWAWVWGYTTEWGNELDVSSSSTFI